MSSFYEELLFSTAEDGATTAADASSNRRDAEEEEALLGAWLRERQENTENRMFLERAQRLFARIVAEGRLSTETDRQARQWMRALKATRRDDRDY